VLDVNTATPTLAMLDAYQAVMVIGSQGFSNGALLGDNLAAYMGQGHGVVVTALSNTVGSCSSQLCGAFQTNDDWAIEPGTLSMNSPATLGTVQVPGSALMAGVTTFNGGSLSYRINGTLNPVATRVANWSDGTPLLATRTIGAATEVAVNFFPVSADKAAGLWVTTTDGGLILANAFNLAAGTGGESDTPEPATYLFAASGLGLLALLLRRRQRTLQCDSAEPPRQR
jgi:hypothetical protein